MKRDDKGNAMVSPMPGDLKQGMELIAAEMQELARERQFYQTLTCVLLRRFGCTSPKTQALMTKKDQLMIQGMGLMIGKVADAEGKETDAFAVWLDTGDEKVTEQVLVTQPKLIVTPEEARKEIMTGKPIIEGEQKAGSRP